MIRSTKQQRNAILFAAPSAYLLGGLATWLDYLQPGLDRLGWDVTIGLVAGPQHHRPERYIAEHPHRRWVSIPCRTGTFEGRRQAMMRAIRNVRPDLVATVNIPDAIAAVARLRNCGEPAPKVAMTLHGIQADLYDDIRMYRDALDGVISTNWLGCRLAVSRGGIESDRVLYAPCGTEVGDEARFETIMKNPHPGPLPEGEGDGPSGSARLREGDSPHFCSADSSKMGTVPGAIERLTIAWVGRLEQDQKRVHDLLPILTGLRERGIPFECLIAGSGPEESRLAAELDAFRLAGQVRLLGRLNPEQLAQQVYQRADVFLLTSVWETGPIVAWEAMGHGLAMISSRYVGSGAEGALIDGENALLFPIGDTTHAIAHLQRLWQESQLRKQIGANGRVTVLHRYTTAKSVEAWDSALRQVLAELDPRPPAAEISTVASGRLDRWLGPRAAESIRALARRKFEPAGPGSEWPHTHSATPLDDPDFWRMAERLDVEHAPVDLQVV